MAANAGAPGSPDSCKGVAACWVRLYPSGSSTYIK